MPSFDCGNLFFHADQRGKSTLIQPNRSAEFFCANLRETLVAFDPKTFEVLKTSKVASKVDLIRLPKQLDGLLVDLIDVVDDLVEGAIVVELSA